MSSVRNADLIEKMTSADKDFRFMAINDIMESLKNKSITLDDTTENQVFICFEPILPVLYSIHFSS